jgi:hypothetical protein
MKFNLVAVAATVANDQVQQFSRMILQRKETRLLETVFPFLTRWVPSRLSWQR